jgi:hypothetical protein
MLHWVGLLKNMTRGSRQRTRPRDVDDELVDDTTFPSTTISSTTTVLVRLVTEEEEVLLLQNRSNIEFIEQ